MITPAELRALLDRYEAAETSVAEERLLKAALAEPGLPTEFAPYRQWFAGLQVLAKAEAKTTAGPWDVATVAPERSNGAKVTSLRDASTSSLRDAPIVNLRVVHRKPATTNWVRWAVAAMLIGIMGFGASLLLTEQQPLGTLAVELPETPTPIDWSKYEVTDPAEATRITRAALAQVSTSIHRGSELTAEELGRMDALQHLLNRKS